MQQPLTAGVAHLGGARGGHRGERLATQVDQVEDVGERVDGGVERRRPVLDAIAHDVPAPLVRRSPSHSAQMPDLRSQASISSTNRAAVGSSVMPWVAPFTTRSVVSGEPR